MILLMLVIVPVVIKQINPMERRALTGVRLAELTYGEVQFHNSEQGVTLGGMLFQPDGEGPFPAAVMIHGSGTSRRDNAWYLSVADYLRRNGVAVLLPDKRGSESSGGDWETASFQDLATDTIAAIRFLKEEHGDVVSEIGVIGFSQGGSIAPIVANQTDQIAFVVNIVGSAMPFHELLVYEENNNLREIGFLPGVSDVIAPPSAYVIREVRQREFWDAVGNYDSLDYWKNVNVPSLILYGERDTNVPSERSAERLRSLEKPNLRVTIFEGSGHALEDPEGTGDRLFRQDALALIREFIFDVISRN